MKIIELIMLASILIFCLVASFSDIKNRVINNKTIICFGVLSVISDFLYYLHNPYLLKPFIINSLCLIVLAVFLYVIHIWGAGDCKFISVLALQYPAGQYIRVSEYKLSLIIPLIIAFLAGYCYLLTSAAITKFFKKEKNQISINQIKKNLYDFFKVYFIVMIYSSAINVLFSCIICKYIVLPDYILIAIYGAVAMLIDKIPQKMVIALICVSCVSDILGVVLFQFIPISLNWNNYLIVFTFVLLRLIIANNNYSTINTSDVEVGMILSYATTLLFQQSKVKGLPNLSTENMKSRITLEEVESIKRWEKSKYGHKHITIVRKIPFAVFISIGFLVYIIMEVIYRAYST